MEESQQVTQIDKIAKALENLRSVQRRGNRFMELVLNGIHSDKSPNEIKGLSSSPPPVIFMSLWENLPESINGVVNDLTSVFIELENKLLK
jgi:hypothetical protein